MLAVNAIVVDQDAAGRQSGNRFELPRQGVSLITLNW